MPPFTVQRIDHLVFRVRDLATSLAFYEKLLGCRAERVRSELGLAHIRVGASMVDLVAPRGPASMNFGAEGEGLSLYVTDPDGNVIELKGPAIAPARGG